MQSFDYTQPHSYCCFIRPSNYPTGQPYYWILNNGSLTNGTSIALQRNGSDTSRSFLNFFYNGGNNTINANQLSNDPSFSDVSVDLNTWTMVTIVYDGSSNITYYINDTNLGTITITANANFNSGNVNPRVGAWQNLAHQFFGDVPVVSVYSKALSDSEVSQNFNAFRDRYGL